LEEVAALLKNFMGLVLVHFQKYWLLYDFLPPYHEQGRQCHGSNNPNIIGQLEIETFTLNTDLSVGGTWQCQAANWFLRLNHDFAFTSGARGAGGRGGGGGGGGRYM
jgi:hypothetical protein